MKIYGRVHKFGNDINTDEIIPAPYLNTTGPDELGGHCMAGKIKDFPKRVKKGDIIVAGRNFGCGSSREHAPISIKWAGISCVIGASFARIFYRNAINIGLPILESAEAASQIKDGDTIEVDTRTGRIKDITQNKAFLAQKFPPFLEEMVKCGGLMRYIKKKNK